LGKQLNVPVYGTAFTFRDGSSGVSKNTRADEARMNIVKPGEKLELGPFSIEFIHVTHSIVQCVALAIHDSVGAIIHTGDFKVDPTRPINGCSTSTSSPLERDACLLLMSDSTKPGPAGYTESESALWAAH